MKRIGLLGGTSWPSTLDYYRRLNQKVAERLGRHHSADILLRSIDYHDIKSRYEGRWAEIPVLLEKELRLTLALPIDCLILCNNTLHKAYDAIREKVRTAIPFFHAVELTADYAKRGGMKQLLLLGTRFTMEDGFYAAGLERAGLKVSLPEPEERAEIQAIQMKLAEGHISQEYRDYFTRLLSKYAHLDAAVLACTELPLAIAPDGNALRVIDPMELQMEAAVAFALR